MILHFIGEHQAAEEFLAQFRECFPHKNIVLKLLNNGSAEIEKEGVVVRYSKLKNAIHQLNFSLITIIDVHLLARSKIQAIVRYMPKDIPIVWWTYGGDLYNHFLYSLGYKLYSNQTLPYVNNYSKNKTLFSRLRLYLYNALNSRRYDKLVIKRIVGIIPCLLPDYEVACKWLNKEFKLVDITPWPDILEYSLSRGRDVMIAHSASLTNNHLYALDILKGMDFGNSRICLPLSYNIQNENYKKDVIERYKDAFGSRVCIIQDMINMNDYYRSFLSFKVAIFPCWRQEALSNIFICLQLGIRVVLSVYNPCYDFFREQGYYISALEQLKDFAPLTEEMQRHNRDLMIRQTDERPHIVSANLKDFFSQYVSLS